MLPSEFRISSESINRLIMNAFLVLITITKKKGATFVAPFFGNPYQRVLSLEPFFPKENLPSCFYPFHVLDFLSVPLVHKGYHPLSLNMSQFISSNTFNKALKKRFFL